MSHPSVIQPALLGKINERQVLRTIQAQGPLSRAELARHSGISAPTASKAVEALLRAGWLEEGDAPEYARGRPARKLRLASETAQVLGLVIDVEQCRVVSAGLDGKLHDGWLAQFPTPPTYEAFVETAARQVRRLMEREGVATLGLAISMPGLIDYRRQRGVLSPNLPMTDGQAPGQDLAALLGIDCVVIQEAHALCLAERRFGNARGMDNFAMLDISTGVGLGVMSGGRLLTGHCGLAGEVGHITVDAGGRACGCGNRGCLETVASDSALALAISERLDRRVGIEEAVDLIQSGTLPLAGELERTCHYLSIGLAAVINLFNPATVFVHGRLFAADGNLFNCLVEETRKRTLRPSFDDCRIIQAQGSKRQGAVAAILEHLTNSVVPALLSDAPDASANPCHW